MRNRIIASLMLGIVAATILTGCNPDPIDQDREQATTTERIGGFVIEEYAPGYDEDWSDIE